MCYVVEEVDKKDGNARATLHIVSPNSLRHLHVHDTITPFMRIPIGQGTTSQEQVLNDSEDVVIDTEVGALGATNSHATSSAQAVFGSRVNYSDARIVIGSGEHSNRKLHHNPQTTSENEEGRRGPNPPTPKKATRKEGTVIGIGKIDARQASDNIPLSAIPEGY